MAAGFIADSASLPLVVSNLVRHRLGRLLRARLRRVRRGHAAGKPVSVATLLLVLFLYFRRDLPPVYALEQLKPPRAAIRDRATFVVGGWMLLVHARRAVRPGAAGRPYTSAVAAACAAPVKKESCGPS
ncbi:ArsB/NhaD family transporter [Pseudomonas aeruginosa]